MNTTQSLQPQSLEPHALEPVQLTVTRDSIRTYAALTDDFNPLHLDPVFAATTAMGRPIAHGTMSLCLIWQCLLRNFGAQAFQDLEVDVRFVKPVYIDDVLTAGGEAAGDEAGSCSVWVRGPDGTDRIVGTVRRRPPLP